jgi:serine/threonine-protein kinase
MELIEGVTLKEHLREGPPSPEGAYDLAIQAARGLNAVHELGIVHRDFKTANIMIDAQGVAKLVDFGIAKDLSTEVTGLTGSLIMGTPEYMSPEQVQGGPAGFASDIYALGCVVYEVFAGHAPFRGATAAAIAYKHLHEDLPLFGEDAKRIPPALVPVLRRALAKEPGKRYETVNALAHDLSRACAADGFAEPPHRGGLRLPPRRPPATHDRDTTATILRRRPRRFWPWALAGVVVVIAVGIGVAYLAFFGPPPTSVPAAGPAPAAGPSTIAAIPATPSPFETALAASPLPLPLEIPDGAPSPPLAASEAPSPPPASPRATSSPSAPSPRPPSPSPRAAARTGTLRLLVVPEARVSVDGTSLGMVSRREVPLAPGTHTVRIEHPDYQPLQRRVAIREGDTEPLVIDLAEKGIRRNR